MKCCAKCGREPFNPDVQGDTQCTYPGCGGVFVKVLLPPDLRRAMLDALRRDDERRAA